jgi:hypothetical protein
LAAGKRHACRTGDTDLGQYGRKTSLAATVEKYSMLAVQAKALEVAQ